MRLPVASPSGGPGPTLWRRLGSRYRRARRAFFGGQFGRNPFLSEEAGARGGGTKKGHSAPGSENWAEGAPNGWLGTAKTAWVHFRFRNSEQMFQAAFVGEADGLSAHFTAPILRRSAFSHFRHLRPVLPSDVATAIMRLSQRGHRVGSITTTSLLPQNGRIKQKFRCQVSVWMNSDASRFRNRIDWNFEPF
jgi:hypothetical protein